MFFAAYWGELLGSECLVHNLPGDLGVRHGGLIKPVSRAMELKMHHNCTESPTPPEGLRQRVKKLNFTALGVYIYGFGCINLKDRGGDRPGALIEWNARIGESHIHTVLAPSLLEMMKELVGRARADYVAGKKLPVHV